VSSSEEWSSYIYDLDIWLPGDDMVTNLLHPFEDELSQHTQSDLQSSFSTHPFEDADLFYEDLQPLCSYFKEYQDMSISEHSEVHSSKRKYFILHISIEIHRGRGDVFLHLRLFLTSYPLPQETM
jgi:hypothetical protein